MKRKNVTLVATSLFLATGALTVATILPTPEVTFAETAHQTDYICADIVVGETMYSGSTKSVPKIDFGTVKFETAYHDGDAATAIRLGSSSNQGKISIDLKNYTCDKVIIYAATYGEASSTLTVNNASQILTSQEFTPITLTFTPTNHIEITNTAKKRISISKIVFRLLY